MLSGLLFWVTFTVSACSQIRTKPLCPVRLHVPELHSTSCNNGNDDDGPDRNDQYKEWQFLLDSPSALFGLQAYHAGLLLQDQCADVSVMRGYFMQSLHNMRIYIYTHNYLNVHTYIHIYICRYIYIPRYRHIIQAWFEPLACVQAQAIHAVSYLASARLSLFVLVPFALIYIYICMYILYSTKSCCIRLYYIVFH